MTYLVPSHIQDSDGLLLSRAADDLVVRGYAHCTKSVVISSVSVANLGCSQRHGKRKEEWTARCELDADDWIKILGILQNKIHQLLRPTHCVTSGYGTGTNVVHYI